MTDVLAAFWLVVLTALAVIFPIAVGWVAGTLLRAAYQLARPVGPRRRPQALSAPTAPRCAHVPAPAPVIVGDRLDGEPEVARWLCPDCGDEVPAPVPCDHDDFVAFSGDSLHCMGCGEDITDALMARYGVPRHD